MSKDKRRVERGLFTRQTLCDLFFFGTLMGILTLSNFVIRQYGYDKGLRQAQTISFMTLVLLFLVQSYNTRPGHRPFWTENFLSSYLLHLSVLFGIVTLLLTLYIPFLQDIVFKQEIPEWEDWVLSLSAAMVFLLFSEIYKLYIRTSHKSKHKYTLSKV